MCGREDGVVPVAMEVVIPDVEVPEGRFRDLDALRVTAPIESAGYREAGFCSGGGDQLDNDLVADQRPAAPIDADKREHAVLDAVPLAGAGRMMGDGDGKRVRPEGNV